MLEGGLAGGVDRFVPDTDIKAVIEANILDHEVVAVIGEVVN